MRFSWVLFDPHPPAPQGPSPVREKGIFYSLFAIRYSLLAIRYSLLAIRYSLFATRYSLPAHEHPVVLPHVSHFKHVPFRTRVKFAHSGQLSPT